MIVTVKYFGMVADVTQKNEEQFQLSSSTLSMLYSLKSKIEEQYLELKNITYSFAVNQSIVNEDMALNHQDEIALLPPFAGG